MTISSTTNRVSFNGNGSTTSFSFPYYLAKASDLTVLQRVIATGVVTTKTLNSDYTVTGTQDASGIYQSGANVVATIAPPSTVQWIIIRDPSLVQSTDYVDGDPLPAASLENPMDLLTIIAQRTRELIMRCLSLADGDTSGASVTIPDVVTRASKFLGFDASGNLTTTQSVGLARGTWATATTYNVGDTVVDGAAGANTGNGYCCVTQHVAGVWATDLAAAKWVLAVSAGAQGPAGASGSGSGNMINTGSSTANHVPKYTGTTGTALADGYAVGTAANALLQVGSDGKLPAIDGSNLTNLATSTNPPGTIIESAALSAPAGYLACIGGTTSRATNAALFAAITQSHTVTITNASPAVVSWTGHPLNIGDCVSFETTGSLNTGLTVGTNYFVIAAGFGVNAFQVSTSRGGSAVNTSSAGSGTQTCRWNPYGCGDGSTTYGLPDKRGRAGIGNDAQGGSAASRVTQAVSGVYANLGATGGDQLLHQHNHGITDPTHAHGGAFISGGTDVEIAGSDSNNATLGNTAAASTGITINNAGTGAAQNVPPVQVFNYFIKT